MQQDLDRLTFEILICDARDFETLRKKSLEKRRIDQELNPNRLVIGVFKATSRLLPLYLVLRPLIHRAFGGQHVHFLWFLDLTAQIAYISSLLYEIHSRLCIIPFPSLGRVVAAVFICALLGTALPLFAWSFSLGHASSLQSIASFYHVIWVYPPWPAAFVLLFLSRVLYNATMH